MHLFDCNLESSEGVVDGPGDNHVVVDDDQEGDDQHAVTQALQSIRLNTTYIRRHKQQKTGPLFDNHKKLLNS